MVRGSLVCVVLMLSFGFLSATEAVAPVSVEKLKAEIDTLRLMLEAEQQRAATLQKLNDAQRTLNHELQKQLDELRKSLEAASRDRDAKLLLMQASLEELKAAYRKQAEEREIAARAQHERDEQIPALKKEVEAIKQQLISEQLKGKALLEKNEALLKQVEESTRRLTQQTKTVTAKPVSLEKVKPAPATRGKVTELDATRQLIVVNLGTDAGVKVGDTLEVFRVAAEPKESLYLGQATVVRTTETSSVCRFSGVTEGRMPRQNDTVATSLTNPK